MKRMGQSGIALCLFAMMSTGAQAAPGSVSRSAATSAATAENSIKATTVRHWRRHRGHWRWHRWRHRYWRHRHWRHRHWGHRHWRHRHWRHRRWAYRHWGYRHWGYRPFYRTHYHYPRYGYYRPYAYGYPRYGYYRRYYGPHIHIRLPFLRFHIR